MPTIGLVDDDRNILTSISIALEAEGYQVMIYAEGFQALHGFQCWPPDLAILDIRMPRMDGLELLRRLRENYKKPVILLTCSDSEMDELSGFQCGADDFIRKPFSLRVLSERIKMLLRRTAPRRSANRIQCGDLAMDLERHTCTWRGNRLALTATEFLILQALASRPGVVKSRETLVEAVYEGDRSLERAIDTHIKRLRQKFRAVSRGCDPIETVYAVGYCFAKATSAFEGAQRSSGA
jgi:two-component system, OmpR family, response regulator ChvI